MGNNVDKVAKTDQNKFIVFVINPLLRTNRLRRTIPDESRARTRKYISSDTREFGLMRYLNGQELRDFIKERQAHQVRGLIQHFKVQPRLAIIQTKQDRVTDLYTRLKQEYGEDIRIVVDLHKVDQEQVPALITNLNNDSKIKGIVVQLPLVNPAETDAIANLVDSKKDVDGLGKDASWDSATAVAINWLLAGYNVELTGRKIAIVGCGRLVGRPLLKMWRKSGYDVTSLDNSCQDLTSELEDKDVIVTATGVPGLIKPSMLKKNAVVVDAGVADDHGRVVGDLDNSIYSRDDLTITPTKGGVGPLTIAALMDNVIRASYPPTTE